MSTQYSIDPAQLTQSASKVQTQSNEIMDRIRQVMREVENSRSFWTGRASGQYERLMTEWNATANKVSRALDDTVKVLQQAAGAYDQTEAQNTAKFAG